MSERITKTPVKTQRKKHKNKLSKSKRKKIWELYDSEIKEQTNSVSDKDTGKDLYPLYAVKKNKGIKTPTIRLFVFVNKDVKLYCDDVLFLF